MPKIVTQNPERFIKALDAHKISRLVLVPSLLASILHFVGNKSKQLQHLRLWVCSGEVLTAHLLRQFYQHLVIIKNRLKICFRERCSILLNLRERKGKFVISMAAQRSQAMLLIQSSVVAKMLIRL